MAKIQFMGAARTVTGSCYLVETGDTKFLVDCGMFQGPDVENRNYEPWPFDPKELDFVLLTHAHIDHSGMLPKLSRQGFKGNIYATNNTVSITSLLLLDSAKIQELNAKAGKLTGDTSHKAEIHYSTSDAQHTISLFKSVRFHEQFQPVPLVNVEYIPAGHILGAASIVIEMEGKRFVFSGDVGRTKHQLIESFDMADKREVDFIVMESLYGGELHPSRESSVFELINIMRETVDRGGNALVPAFSVDRTQNLLLDIKRAKEAGSINQDTVVFMDSPLASKVTEIYAQAVDSLQVPVNEEEEFGSPFKFPGLRMVRSGQQSRRLKTRNGSIIVAGSGMVNGGRILSHVAAHMPHKQNSLTLIGYQAEETLGRELSEGAKELIIDGHKVEINGDVHHLAGFSAHGDEQDLINWLSRYQGNRLQKVMLVHADMDRSQAFSARLAKEGIADDQIAIPDWKEVIELQ